MICNLSDDGARLLWLEFRGPGGEEELDMGKNPKVIDLKNLKHFPYVTLYTYIIHYNMGKNPKVIRSDFQI